MKILPQQSPLLNIQMNQWSEFWDKVKGLFPWQFWSQIVRWKDCHSTQIKTKLIWILGMSKIYWTLGGSHIGFLCCHGDYLLKCYFSDHTGWNDHLHTHFSNSRQSSVELEVLKINRIYGNHIKVWYWSAKVHVNGHFSLKLKCWKVR